jgi:2-dehydropantoate 2-reductase
VDRGEQLDAIRSGGLRLIEPDGTIREVDDLPAVADPAELGSHDFVLLGVKAYQVEEVAPRLEPLLGRTGTLVTLQNGLPWWYFQDHGGEHDGRGLRSVDPQGTIASHVSSDRILGCVAYPAATVEAPGVVRLVEGNRFTLGELDGSTSTRATDLQQALIGAGFKSYVIDDIRAELWLKAWGALSFNTISALTGATMVDICRESRTRALVEAMMTEAHEVATKLGVTMRHTIEKRIRGAEQVGAHKTSMLQDVEAGRELETDAIIGAILELAELTGTPAPSVRAVHACCTLLNARLKRGAAG